MFRTALLAALSLAGSVSAAPTKHTMTITNGSHVEQHTFVLCHGTWRTGQDSRCDVFVRDDAGSPWRLHCTCDSPRRAEQAACSLRAKGCLASVRPHCP
jgi:hypothetical protein